MGVQRNGARLFLELIQKLCRLSHLPGFQAGVKRILGDTDGQSLLDLWDPVCTLVDHLVSLDDYFNKRDATEPDAPSGEDGPFG